MIHRPLRAIAFGQPVRCSAMSSPLHRLLVIGLALLAGACFGRFEVGSDQPRIPDGPIERMGEDPTGPVVTLGSGMAEETGWRFVAYESGGAYCLQVELNTGSGGSGAAGCAQVNERVGPLSHVGAGGGGNGVGHVEGVASRDVAEVSVRAAGGRRIPATLHDLNEIGLDAQAFFALIPAATDPTSVVALDADGKELGRSDVSFAFR